ncbi:hypothetical protein DUZ99_10320 [Xylanibacillus composti]|uniref:Uncharacterized protein n=1 Tax=Xylanibacillus composti TaxID=1572762 RepID=A0A8J4H593_9BACL|nr:hypothetical protein [Xylanibacillus composti]MDT9725365.1 hypothetical protein [Xylanibacillus composti]GIQ69129.1 hypothetical protein XYCOK13_19530 [Xylanibacillus composti]
MEWNKLEDLLTRTFYPIGISGDVPNPLNRWLVKSAQGPLSSPFDDPLAELGGRILLAWEEDQLEEKVKETNWRFHISDMVHRYQEPNRIFPLFTSRPDNYMYACTGVYCSRDTDVVVNVLPYFPSPIRIWINGELALCGPRSSIVNNTHFMYRLRAGMNAVLVECPLFHPISLTYNEFIVHLHPVQHLLETGKDWFFDPAFLSYLQQSYCLVPDRTEVRAGETVRLLVQPLYLGDSTRRRESLLVSAQDSAGSVVAEANALPGQVITLQMPADQPIGVLRLQVRSLAADQTLGRLFLACGEIAEIAQCIEAKLPSRSDFHPDVQRSVQFAAELPRMLQEVHQYCNRGCREEALRTLYETERYLHSAAGEHPVQLHQVFPRIYTYVQTKTTSSGTAACTIILPDHYNPERAYPVVFFFHDPQARQIPVHLPWTAWTSTRDAIIACLPGIGRRNDADDLQTIRTIRGVMAHLNADRERIYGIGFCYGSTKLFQIAMLVPHLFAAIAPIIGDPRLDSDQPEYARIDNLQQLAIYGISSVQNWFYNSLRMRHALSRIPQSRTCMVHGYMHNEVNDFLNSRLLLRRLTEHRLTAYPRSVRFAILNPACNKAYWIEGISLYDRGEKTAFIEAEWSADGDLHVQTRNIREVTLLSGRRESGCEDRFRLTVNASRHEATLGSDYASLALTLNKEGRLVQLRTEAISQSDFETRLTAIAEDTDKLGLRKLYVSNPLIVKPSPAGDPRRSFHLQLSYLLQHPIGDRYIHYHYRACYEHQLDPSQLESETLLYLIDLRRMSDAQEEVLRKLGLAANAAAMELDGHHYAGDYAMMAIRRDCQRLIEIVAYNSDASGEALLELWKTFDANPVFLEETVIWHEGKWNAPAHLLANKRKMRPFVEW